MPRGDSGHDATQHDLEAVIIHLRHIYTIFSIPLEIIIYHYLNSLSIVGSGFVVPDFSDQGMWVLILM